LQGKGFSDNLLKIRSAASQSDDWLTFNTHEKQVEYERRTNLCKDVSIGEQDTMKHLSFYHCVSMESVLINLQNTTKTLCKSTIYRKRLQDFWNEDLEKSAFSDEAFSIIF
jgi:hypothetical protein